MSLDKYISAFKILSPKAVKRMLLLVPVIFVSTLLEALSVGVVVPTLGIIMNDNYLERFPIFASLFSKIGDANQEILIIIGLCLLASAFIVKNIFIYFHINCQGTFVYSARREIALNLFGIYLRKSYLFHLKKNTSELLSNLTNEVKSYCDFFLMPFLNLITELLIILAILALILWFETTGAIILIIFSSFIIYLFVSKSNQVVGEWGKKRLIAEKEKISHLQHGLGGIKEILLSGKIDFFHRRFHLPNQISGLMDKREYIFQYIPKLGVEVIVVCAIVIMCLFLVSKGKSSEEITLLLGLMASAGFRIVPSFSRILNNLQAIRYGWASVDVLRNEFSNYTESDFHSSDKVRDRDSPRFAFKKEITLSKVSFSYDDEVDLLDSIDLSIVKGTTIGFTGESGCGKSTLADLILGLIRPKSGKIMIDGHVVQDKEKPNWFKMIGYVPQDIYIMDDTIRNNIAFGFLDDEIDDDRIWEVLKIVNLRSFVEEKPNGLDTFLGECGANLSGGQKQRFGVARALYHDPDILILDEFTNALDRVTEKEILKTFRPLQGVKTILIISHSELPLALCDQDLSFR